MTMAVASERGSTRHSLTVLVVHSIGWLSPTRGCALFLLVFCTPPPPPAMTQLTGTKAFLAWSGVRNPNQGLGMWMLDCASDFSPSISSTRACGSFWDEPEPPQALERLQCHPPFSHGFVIPL